MRPQNRHTGQNNSMTTSPAVIGNLKLRDNSPA